MNLNFIKKILAVLGALICLQWTCGLQARLILDDFEEGNRWKPTRPAESSLETKTVKDGTSALRWTPTDFHSCIVNAKGTSSQSVQTPKDWSSYSALQVWIYSAKPNRNLFGLAITSESDVASEWSYFFKKIQVDWEGWKCLVFRLDSFSKTRSPSWGRIKNMMFSLGWSWAVFESGSSVIIDEIALLTEEELTNVRTE